MLSTRQVYMINHFVQENLSACKKILRKQVFQVFRINWISIIQTCTNLACISKTECVYPTCKFVKTLCLFFGGLLGFHGKRYFIQDLNRMPYHCWIGAWIQTTNSPQFFIRFSSNCSIDDINVCCQVEKLRKV